MDRVSTINNKNPLEIVFNRSHSPALLEKEGINISKAQDAVKSDMNSLNRGSFTGRVTVDGKVLEYRSRIINDKIVVGTLFPVK